MEKLLGKNRATAAANTSLPKPVAGGSSSQKKVAGKAAEQPKVVEAGQQKRPALGVVEPPPKRTRVDETVTPMLAEASGKVIPADLSAFRGPKLSRSLVRVGVLPADYDSSMELDEAVRLERMSILCYKVSSSYC